MLGISSRNLRSDDAQVGKDAATLIAHQRVQEGRVRDRVFDPLAEQFDHLVVAITDRASCCKTS